MTDIITTAPISIRCPGQLRLELPKLGIGAAVALMSKAIGQAFTMAYVVPYQTSRQSPSAKVDADLEGRDPSW